MIDSNLLICYGFLFCMKVAVFANNTDKVFVLEDFSHREREK